MDDQPSGEDPEVKARSLPMTLAMGAALGPVMGVLMLAITGEAIWLALSPSFGVAIALVYHVSRQT